MTATTKFVLQYYCLAKQVERRYGVPHLVCLGQASVESANGNAAPRYNFFGIKAFSNWHGQVQEFVTTDDINGQIITHKQKFRAYSSPKEGFLDYGNYLRNSGLYNAAFAYTNDPYTFIQKIGSIYATSYYANIVSGRMQTIQNIIAAERPKCFPTLLLPMVGVIGLGVGVAASYDFNLDEMVDDLKKKLR